MSPTHTKPFDLEAVRAEYPILERKNYMNSCSLGALSRRSELYLNEFTEHWHDMGASAWYRHWLGRVEDLRGRVSSFWGSKPEETALLPSVSAALSVVTQSVPEGTRNRVVCTELDFPTLAYQWAVKPEIELVVLKSPDGVRIDPEQFAERVHALVTRSKQKEKATGESKGARPRRKNAANRTKKAKA